MFYNFDMDGIITPVNPNRLRQMLREAKYDEEKTKYLVEGFTHGFDIRYEGMEERKDIADNIPLKVGNKVELWNKIMKEVKEKRFLGPYEKIPFDKFVQSPIGLVPKAGGKTRLIFHLSYDFKGGTGHESINFNTPQKLCKVKYLDLDYAIRCAFKWGEPGKCFFSKTDVQSAFRLVPLSKKAYNKLMMKAICPLNNKTYYFADKNLPFGHSISCKKFQDFSDAVRHILEHKTGIHQAVTNYLDDFLFVADSPEKCNYLVRTFLEICECIGIPISQEENGLGITKNGVFRHSIEWRRLHHGHS